MNITFGQIRSVTGASETSVETPIQGSRLDKKNRVSTVENAFPLLLGSERAAVKSSLFEPRVAIKTESFGSKEKMFEAIAGKVNDFISRKKSYE